MADPELGDTADEMAELIVTADEDEPADPETVEGDEDTEDEEVEEEPEPEPDAKEDEAEKLRSEIKKEINRLGFAVRKGEVDDLKAELARLKADKAKPKDADEDPDFTDAQLLQMMKDHSDEPEVMFQIMKQMQKQAGKSIEKKTESMAKITETRKELLGITEKVMPGALEEGTKLYSDVQTSKSYLGLEEHPYGDVLSLAMMSFRNVPKLVQNVKDTMRKELLGKGANTNRKEAIKAESLAGKGTKKAAAKKLTEGENDAVKRLGLTKNQLKYYNKFIGKNDAVQTTG